MESMPREEIERLTKKIFADSDYIVKHGTSYKNADSIMATGFNWWRTSFVEQKDKNVEHLAGYMWKENGPNDAANVVLSIPKEFIKIWFGLDDEKYSQFIQQRDIKGEFMSWGCIFEQEGINGNFKNGTPPILGFHLPPEFVAGAYFWCDGKTYLNLYGTNESAMDHLHFVPNPRYFCNLSPEEKAKFVKECTDRLQSRLGEAKNNSNEEIETSKEIEEVPEEANNKQRATIISKMGANFIRTTAKIRNAAKTAGKGFKNALSKILPTSNRSDNTETQAQTPSNNQR